MVAKVLIGVGAALLIFGITIHYAPWLVSWFGKLPGDIDIVRDGTRVFIPITSMIVASIVITVLVNLLFRR